MDDFSEHYSVLVNQENSLIQEDHYILPDVKENLYTLLENYMGDTDTTSYKEQHRDVIFTLARQLKQYGIENRESTNVAKQYYGSLYGKFKEDVLNYGTNVSNKTKQCGGLLQLLYDLFNDIGVNPSEDTSIAADASTRSEFIDITY